MSVERYSDGELVSLRYALVHVWVFTPMRVRRNASFGSHQTAFQAGQTAVSLYVVYRTYGTWPGTVGSRVCRGCKGWTGTMGGSSSY